MAQPLQPAEWARVFDQLENAGDRHYDVPERRENSVVFASWNLRKLGGERSSHGEPSRTDGAYKLIVHFLRNCDLISIQEIQDDRWSLHHVHELLNQEGTGDYRLVVSDVTGEAPGHRGMRERLGFIYNAERISLGEIISDLAFDRSAVIENVNAALADMRDVAVEEASKEGNTAWLLAKLQSWGGLAADKMSSFVSFLRTPYLVSFIVQGEDDTDYRIGCVDAHLLYGTKSGRQGEFFALLDWLVRRGTVAPERLDAPITMLMADLNLDFDSSTDARKQRIEDYVTSINGDRLKDTGAGINFPFLDVHPEKPSVFRTNARKDQTYDHIAFISRDRRLPRAHHNNLAGTLGPDDYDYGQFDFVDLFKDAGVAMKDGAPDYDRFIDDVSDHMPIWLRLAVPHAGQRVFDVT